MKRIILFLAVILSAVSCTTYRYVSATPDLQSAWIGKTHADVVRAYGAPTRECSDGVDGYILIYESFRTHYDTWMDGSINSSREIRDFKEFYFGPDHICYDVRSNDRIPDGRVFNLMNTVWSVSLALPLLLFLVTL